MNMRKFSPFLYFALSAFAAVAPFCSAPPQAFAQQQDTLYHRLGGYDALAAVTDDFIQRLSTDPQEKRFFGGLSVDSQKRLRQHVVDFLCSATGGPCYYTGRDMKTAHTGLKITEDDWNAAVKDLVATLDKFKVPDKEKNEVLTAVSGLKGDIVGQ
jgi:hemoglobin